jgi:hypothetical protein
VPMMERQTALAMCFLLGFLLHIGMRLIKAFFMHA